MIGFLLLFVPPSLAFGTDSFELEMVPDDLVPFQSVDVVHRLLGQLVQIVDPAALDTAYVIVPVRVAVESLFGAGHVHLDDRALANEKIEVAVDCAETDPGEPFPDSPVKIGGRGMGLEPLELVEDDVPLA
jgi:hypothetical protein